MKKYWKEKLFLREHFTKSLKIAIAALLSIFIAGELELASSSTAGIITVLSIQRTKKETVKSAVNRIVAYVFALVLAAICFHFLGYTLPAFAVYLFLFSFLCMLAGWQEAITTDSVLISHFFQEGNMGLSILGNETLLLLIGAGMGVLMNLHLHSKDADYAKMEAEVDDRIKEILRRLADGLSAEQESFYFLEQALQKAKICAAVNYKNTFFRKDMYPLEYIRMRSQQTVVLKGICENLRKVSHLPKQALAVAALFGDVEQAYQKENTVVKLLGRLYEVMEDMKKEKLPQSREEFEARAILYYVLLQMEEFLIIKKEFAKGLKMRVEQ